MLQVMFSPKEDICRLAKQLRLFRSTKSNCVATSFIYPVLDLQEVFCLVCPESAGNGWKRSKPSLADVKTSLLGSAGRPQKKSKLVQASDWEQRPLSPEQLAYAAGDATVLLDLLDFMQSVPAVRSLLPALANAELLLRKSEAARYVFSSRKARAAAGAEQYTIMEAASLSAPYLVPSGRKATHVFLSLNQLLVLDYNVAV